MMNNLSADGAWRNLGARYLCSAAVIAILAGSGTAHADRLVVTNGSTITQNGGSFSNISDAASGAAVYASGSGSTIKGTSLFLDSGAYTKSSAAYASNGGKIDLIDTTITGGIGLSAETGNALVTMTGGSIASTKGAVVSKSGSFIVLNDVIIEDSGSSIGAVQVSSGNVTMTGGSIISTGTARGVYVRYGTATLDGISISSASDALFNMQTAQSDQPSLIARNFSAVTSASNAYGLNANVYSNSLLENGSIHTQGENAHGIWATAYSSAVGSTIVTGNGLSIRTEGTSANGVFSNAAVVNLTGTDIEVGRAYGLYAQSAGTISLQGGSVAVGAGGTAVLATAPGSRIDVDGVVIQTTGDEANGLYSHNQSVVTAKNSSVSIFGEGGYGIFSTSQGTVIAENTDILTTGTDTYAIAFLGATAANKVTITGGTVAAQNSIAVFAKGGTDSLSLTDTTVSGDSLLYAGSYEQSGTTYGSQFSLTADNSTPKGGAQVDQFSSSTLNLGNGTLWTLTPSADGSVASAVSVLNIDDSTVAFSVPTADAYQTLTVGSGIPGTIAVYNATGNAQLHLNTFLNEGGALSNQKTDRLLINGDVTGTTTVMVTGVAGSTGGLTSPTGQNLATEGISIIQASGVASENSFRLLGGYTTMNGLPYQYALFAYGPESGNGAADESQRLVAGTNPFWDYRLQNVYVSPPVTPDPDPDPDLEPDPDPDPNPDPGGKPVLPPDAGTPVRAVAPQVANYLTAPTALFHAGLLDISNLHRRLGEIRDDRVTGRSAGTGEVFARAYGGRYGYASNRNAYSYGYDADIDYSAVQTGGSLYALEGKNGVARFGIAGSIGSLSFDPKNVAGAAATDLDTWSVSAYATYLHDSGWYIDGILSYGGFSGHVSTSLRGRTASLTGNSFSASIETGYPFRLGGGLVLEPQAQLVYQRLTFDRKLDVDGFAVALGNQEQLTARVGARLSKTYALTGEDNLFTVYAKANVVHSFSGGGEVFLGDTFRLGRFGTSVEGGVGVNATLSKNLSLYADAAYQQHVGKSGVSGFTVTGGLRYSF